MSSVPASPLPLYLETQTVDSVKARMLAAFGLVGKNAPDGSNYWNVLSPVWTDLPNWAIFASGVQYHCFLISAMDEWLDQWGINTNTPRLGAQAATGAVLFSGTPGTLIPAGTQVFTSAGFGAASVVFTTNTDVTIDSGGTIVALITAASPGANGNVAPSAINQFQPQIPGVTGVTNTAATGVSPFTVGRDTEPNGRIGVFEFYRGRIALKLQMDQTPGSEDWYVSQAMALGAGVVRVNWLWNGPGTVQLVILDGSGNIPSPPSGPGSLAQTIQDSLDPAPQGTGQGPGYPLAGTRVTVTAAKPRSIPLIVPGVVPASGYTLTQAKTDLELAVQAYFNLAALGGTVLFERVGGAIANTLSVANFTASGLRLNGSTSDLVLAHDEAAVLSQPVSYPT